MHKVSFFTSERQKMSELIFNSPEFFVDIRDNSIVLFALFKSTRFNLKRAVFNPRITKVVRLKRKRKLKFLLKA